MKDLKQKWSSQWRIKDQYQTVWNSGYTQGETCDWALTAQSWYPDAYEVWQRMFSHKWEQADLSSFLRVVTLKMGDDWRTRYEPAVRDFYFKAKHALGYAPRYDQLVGVEKDEKMAALAKAKEWHRQKIPRLRKEARDIRVRSQASYLFDEREVARRMRAYANEKAHAHNTKKVQEMRKLRELCAVLHERQEHRMRKRIFEREQAKLREQRLLKTVARARALRKSRAAHDVIEQAEASPAPPATR